ncbi:MAG: prepilin-type N-terminal cleavage/methylation domain-containing protein [Patescibacteria group bacterium]|nr:prepilin-type N-terminal cleavage/methylation domain-containing protein [Patescibacteria group bacterium]MDD4610992.1 prepilin-type N-terminal cleavage/methylation domain-containing protein [Patescibacteria group bacterium]
MKRNNQFGFTLIELLIVIAIIAIIAAVAFVALDPLTRFKDSRDSRRWQDVTSMADAIVVKQVDNRGYHADIISSSTADLVYPIGSCTSGCVTAACDTSMGTTTHLDLSELVTDGYLGAIPVSPDGTGSWSTSTTGYTLEKKTTGAIIIRSCESENSDEIKVIR